MKYNYFKIEGYWDDEPNKIHEYKISPNKWDGKYDSDDEEIFYYLDGDEKPKVGDSVVDGFIITNILT